MIFAAFRTMIVENEDGTLSWLGGIDNVLDVWNTHKTKTLDKRE